VTLVERYLRNEPVGAFGEGGDDPQWRGGIAPAQLDEERANLLAMMRQVDGAQVSMSCYADDDRQPPVRHG
jgi:hypothetical protein